jgi:rare lipoprotein A
MDHDLNFISRRGFLAALACSVPSAALGKIYPAAKPYEVGIASYYSHREEGHPTASGEIFRSDLYTAAHRALPFGTMVRVTNLDNDRSVLVKINDRGPAASGRLIDLSGRAARDLDMTRSGVAKVRVDLLSADR